MMSLKSAHQESYTFFLRIGEFSW